MTFYVYYHIDPVTKQIKYVGKGKSGRAFCFRKRSMKHLEWIAILKQNNLEPEVRIVQYFDTECEALNMELYLIDHLRHNGHELLNAIDKRGSNNGMYGKKRPDLTKRNVETAGKKYEQIYGLEKAYEIKKTHSRRSSSTGNPMYGKRGSLAPTFGRTGKLHPMFGKKHSESSKNRISQSLMLNRGIKVVCSNGVTYNSITQAAKSLNVNAATIRKSLTTGDPCYVGFSFRYMK